MILVNSDNVVLVNGNLIEEKQGHYILNKNLDIFENDCTIYDVDMPKKYLVSQTLYVNGEFSSIELPSSNIITEVIADPDKIKTPVNDIKRAIKLKEVGLSCEQTIYAGIDIGDEHFSLTQNDQINISSCYSLALSGEPNILYHADNALCRLFSIDEIKVLMQKSKEFKTYHTTYCNHLNTWIKRVDSQEELNTIYYGVELPSDIKEHFDNILGLNK